MRRLYILLIALLCSGWAFSQNFEYGDAPENSLAYPQSGVIGAFPTCVNVGPALFIRHTNFGGYFSPAFDLEGEGNAGFCAQFPPYDADECYNDGDAGLVMPQPYTISGGIPTVITCPNSQGTSLGMPCTPAIWGQTIDIRVTNNMPGNTTGFVNVLFDWDRNGFWAGASPCPGAAAPEHVLFNFPVPNGFTGLLSQLGPPPFLIGPGRGVVWARFSFTEIPVTIPWAGDGNFEDGETEDYLLYIGDYDFGDAPEQALAYPVSRVVGNFPTCQNTGAAGSFIKHMPGPAFFGPLWDGEQEGNAGRCPAFNPNLYDQDECFMDADAGLILPSAFTIAGPVGSEAVVPCANTSIPLDTICRIAQWGPDVDINVTGPGFVQVLMDWDQNGVWAFNQTTQCSGIVIPEYVLADFPVPPGFSGPLSALNPPAFQVGPNAGYVWTRFSITDVALNNFNWDGSGNFASGETEDYLLKLVAPTIDVNEPGYKGIPFRVIPNPAQDAFRIEFVLFEPTELHIDLLGLDGRLIRTIRNARMPKGSQIIEFEFGDRAEIPDGLYLVRLMTDSGAAGYQKIVLQR